jgi:hypothetical protein
MAIDWLIKGPWFTTCNCAVGCPCQFNSLPTHGHCRAALGCEIAEGHFGNVKLDGVRFGGLFAWPGPIHEGGGEAQPIIDSTASPEQRDAVLAIMKGEETEPGATIFNVFAATLDKVHDPIFAPMAFECDSESRTARLVVADVVEASGEPVRNPVTGAEHRVRIDIPHGFEYSIAEIGTGTTKTGTRAAVPLDWHKAHAHFVDLQMSDRGIIR